MKDQYMHPLVAIAYGLVDGATLCALVILCLWVYHL